MALVQYFKLWLYGLEKLRLEKMGRKLLDLERTEKGALSKSNKRKEPPFLSDMSTVVEKLHKKSHFTTLKKKLT